MSPLGPVVGLVARNSVDYIRCFHRLATGGRVVVPLRSAQDEFRIRACGVEEITEPGGATGWLDEAMHWADTPDIAQVAFTSGTEGEPRGILLTHANLANTIGRLQHVMHMDASIREYVGVPVYHSFGFARCRAVLAAGGRAYLPSAGFSVSELARLLEAGEVNAVSAVPSLWRVVLKFRDSFARVGRAVRWVEIGSQPMSGQEKAAVRTLFPEATIVQHYGLTEASRATFLDVGTADPDALESVGRPVGDVEVAVDSGGRIRIRGGNVAREMLRGGERVPLVDAEGWLTTNDLGELRGGNLYYLGRADDMINVAGIKIPPEALERGMATALGVAEDYCVARVPDPMRGDGVLIAAHENLQRSDAELVDAAARALSALGVEARSSLAVMRVARLPVTDSGKVRRRELAGRYAESMVRPAAAPEPVPATASPVQALVGIYAGVFPNANVTPADSFVSLGGDSLSFVELATGLEATLGRLPAGWEKQSIAELATAGKRTSWVHAMDLSVVIRAVAIAAIVIGHYGWVDLQGGAFLLLVVAGFSFARFQLPGVVESGSVRSILRLAGNIALPTFIAMSILELRQHRLDVPGSLLVKNWVSTNISSVDYWFLELLVQILLLVALLLASRRVRTLASRHAFGLGAGLLLVSLLAVVFVPALWNTEHIFNRVPHMLAWLFFLGWAAQCARSVPVRLFVALLAIAGAGLAWAEPRFWVEYATYWVVAGTVLLMTVRTIPVPWPLHRVVAAVAGASLFIYITHEPLVNLAHKAGIAAHPAGEVIVALVLGVLVHRLWEGALRLVASRARVGGAEPETRSAADTHDVDADAAGPAPPAPADEARKQQLRAADAAGAQRGLTRGSPRGAA